MNCPKKICGTTTEYKGRKNSIGNFIFLLEKGIQVEHFLLGFLAKKRLVRSGE